jgi:hypothetical protein
LDLQLPVQSVPITTKVISSNQLYVVKFVSDLRQVDGFLRLKCTFLYLVLTMVELKHCSLGVKQQSLSRLMVLWLGLWSLAPLSTIF